MLFHQRNHAAQHRGGQRLGRLFHLDDLEAPRERRVLLEVFLVFAPGGRGNGAQLAARERRLEQVGRIALAGLAARTDHGVGFVDEQDDRMRALLDLVDHILQAVLKLALDRRAGLQQPHVEHMQRHALERRRHITRRDAQREAFDDRGLAHAGLAGKDGVVLAPTHQDVDRLTDFGVAPDHRVDLAVVRALREVGRELIERGRARRAGGCCFGALALGTFSRRRRACGRAARHRGFGRARGDLVEAMLEFIDIDLDPQGRAAQRELRQIGRGQQSEQQMAAANLRALRIHRGDQPGMFEQLGQVRREHRRARIARLEARQLVLEIVLQIRRVHAELGEHDAEIALGLFEQSEAQVFEIHLVMPARHAQVGGAFCSLAAGRVEFADQRLEVIDHECAQWMRGMS